MKRLRLAVVALALLVALVGCGWKGEGVVIGKEHRDAYSTVTMVYCGKGCMVPTTQYHPERWYLIVEGKDGKNHRVSVSEQYQESARIGQYFSNEEQP